MTAEELLLELKDIQAPAEPGWWLLAPGYVAIFCLLATTFIFLWFAARSRKRRRLVICARQDLRRIESSHLRTQDSRQLALNLSKWLKQVALLAYPEQHLDGITGSHWLQFLDQTLGDASFSRGDGRIFGDAVYQPQTKLDANRVCALCDQWLAAVKPRLLQRGRE